MGGYHDPYLKNDILPLADLFQNFREAFQDNYKLDPVHYFTLPGLSWDAMLKITKIELQFMDDVNMSLIVENGMRGDISSIMHRYGTARQTTHLRKTTTETDRLGTSPTLMRITYMDGL